jgi:hypothetical protein
MQIPYIVIFSVAMGHDGKPVPSAFACNASSVVAAQVQCQAQYCDASILHVHQTTDAREALVGWISDRVTASGCAAANVPPMNSIDLLFVFLEQLRSMAVGMAPAPSIMELVSLTHAIVGEYHRRVDNPSAVVLGLCHESQQRFHPAQLEGLSANGVASKCAYHVLRLRGEA